MDDAKEGQTESGEIYIIKLIVGIQANNFIKID